MSEARDDASSREQRLNAILHDYLQAVDACRSRKPRRPTGSTPKGPVSDALRSEGERVQAANSV
jgi:hypothetical protein